MMSGLLSAGPHWHQTEERWTELSFYSASAWNEVWRTLSLERADDDMSGRVRFDDVVEFKFIHM